MFLEVESSIYTLQFILNTCQLLKVILYFVYIAPGVIYHQSGVVCSCQLRAVLVCMCEVYEVVDMSSHAVRRVSQTKIVWTLRVSLCNKNR